MDGEVWIELFRPRGRPILASGEDGMQARGDRSPVGECVSGVPQAGPIAQPPPGETSPPRRILGIAA